MADKNLALQMIGAIVASSVDGAPAQNGGLLDVNRVNTNPFPTTPVVAPPVAYVKYKSPELSAYTINADGIGRTAIDPNKLSRLPEVQRLMASFEKDGYAVQGYDVVARANEVYPTDEKQYVIRIGGVADPVNAGMALASEFGSGVDPNGNPHPGKWTLTQADRAAGRDYYTYTDPNVASWDMRGVAIL